MRSARAASPTPFGRVISSRWGLGGCMCKIFTLFLPLFYYRPQYLCHPPIRMYNAESFGLIDWRDFLVLYFVLWLIFCNVWGYNLRTDTARTAAFISRHCLGNRSAIFSMFSNGIKCLKSANLSGLRCQSLWSSDHFANFIALS